MKAVRLVRALLAGLLGAFAGLAFGPVFGGVPGPAAFVAALAAATGAATVVAVAAVLAPKLSPTLLAVGGALAVAAVAVTMTGSGVKVMDGPWRLLTGALPADPAGPPLGIVALAAGWCALLAGLLAAYAGNALAPAVPPLVCLLAALGLGASGPALPAWYAPAGVALVLALLFTGRSAPPRPGVLVTAVVSGVIAVAVTVFLGPAAPGADTRAPADARTLVSAPVLPRSGVSPLQQYLALRDETLPLKITGTTSFPRGPLRMATLTHFDGTYWTVVGDFRLAGKRLTIPPPAGHPVTVHEHVRIDSKPLDWVIGPGRTTRLTVAGMGVDEATGDVAVPVGTDSPAAYDATSVVDQVGAGVLRSGDPSPSGAPLTPPLPGTIRGFVERTVAGKTSPCDQLVALYKALKSSGEFRYDQAKDVTGGHGYYQIQRLLRSRRGTSEQYASAFAVMVRSLGLDARVVMGFQPHYQGNAFTVSGSDVEAWAEVRFEGSGWVTVDPSPRDNPIGTRPDQPTTTTRTGQIDDPLKDTTKPTQGSHAGSKGKGPISVTPSSGHGLLLLAGVPAAAIILLLLLGIPGAKAARRARRRRDRSPRRAVLGAWWETVDRLREAGIPAGPGLTTGEVAGLIGHVPGVRTLASMVDHAAYAPDATPPDLPARAWTAATEIRKDLRARMPIRVRVGASLNPRSLFVRNR